MKKDGKRGLKEEFNALEHSTFTASRKDKRAHRVDSARQYVALGILDKKEAAKTWNVSTKDL